ncbi:ATP-binding cassette domain-containing protein [Streptomyces sp. NPDC041068]|uniref:ABC transporter ATP-binding protein n=1 Tax=Streptomyces sp. NPDC041068 TaxID=3155130 RepID=UPI0033E1ECB8
MPKTPRTQEGATPKTPPTREGATPKTPPTRQGTTPETPPTREGPTPKTPRTQEGATPKTPPTPDERPLRQVRTHLRAGALLIVTAFHADARRAVLVLALAPVVGGCGVVSGLAIREATDAALRHELRPALTAAALLVAAVVTTYAAGAFVSALRIHLQQQVGLHLDRRLIRLTGGIPALTHHEHPGYLDRMDLLRAHRGQLGGAFGALVENLRALFGLGTTLALLVTVHPALLALPLFALPTVAAAQRGNTLIGRAEAETAEADRLRRTLLELSCSPEAAREIRIYGLADELARRHEALHDDVVRHRGRADTRAAVWSGGGWLVFAAGYLGGVLLAIVAVARDQGTPGDVVLTLVLGAQLLGSVSGMVALGSWLQHALRAAGHFLWLADHAALPENAATRPGSARTAPRPGGELVLDHVSFTYPGAERPVLSDVCLRVPAGTTLAVVGENGAGKTTLAKLLCRMYEPTSGTITYDGTDIATFDVHAWRRALTACFQDFQRFEFTLRTAVGLGDLPRADAPHAVDGALRRGGGAALPALLPQGLDTQLGAAFPGGVDLSTGQWQKVAMSRATMRERPALLILDEPTASLDAASEHDLFTRFTAASRTSAAPPVTVLVSHRFATVRMADLIVVLDGGTIRERGSHDRLLAHDGLYAELYRLGMRGSAS